MNIRPALVDNMAIDLTQLVCQRFPHLPSGHHKQIAAQLKQHAHTAYALETPPPPAVSDWQLITDEGPGSFSVGRDVMRPEVMASRFLAEYLYAHEELYRDKSVVDMGCGSGLLGVIMARKKAKKVYLCDIMADAVKNACLNVELMDLKSTCTCLSGNLFERIPAIETIDLIVFNHPFFAADFRCLPEYPIAQTMLASPDLIRSFFEQAKARGYNCPIIMPFFTEASKGIDPKESNDPAYWASQFGYSVVIERSENICSGLQQGYHRIYELTPRSGTRLCGLVRNKGEQYEIDWGKVILESRTSRGELKLSHTTGRETTSPIAESPSATEALEPWLQERVAANLALQIFDLVRSVKGLLQIYFVNDADRLPSEIIGESTLDPWPKLNELYKRDRPLLKRTLDPSREILKDFTVSPMDGFPFYIVYEQRDRPAVESAPAVELRRLYSARVTLAYGKPRADGTQAGESYEEPSSDVIDAAGASDPQVFGRWLRRDSRNKLFVTYVELMARYFNENWRCGDHALNNLSMVLLPLWSGTRRKPIEIGSLLLFCTTTPSAEDLFLCFKLAIQYLAPVRTQQFHAEARYHARRSAIAAIIGRNLSHNIGSHVLAGLTADDIAGEKGNEEKAEKATENTLRLMSYLQQRMDFLARAATEWPDWREPVFFLQALLHDFLSQWLLLDKLVRDDGYPISRIQFSVKCPFSSERVELHLLQPKEEWQQSASDFLVAVPGGVVGRQAFYGFLENAIRNAAKHNPKQKSLTVFLDIDEEKDSRFFTITYRDNLSISRGNLVAQIQIALQQPVIDEAMLQRNEKDWGMQEMKVYADFLLWPYHYGEEHALHANKSLITIQNGETREVLSYAFRLLRATQVCFVGDCPPETEDMRKMGIRTKPAKVPSAELVEGLRTLAPGLTWLSCPPTETAPEDWLNSIGEFDQRLPGRILIDKQSNQELEHGIRDRRLCGRVFVSSLGQQVRELSTDKRGREKVILNLYREWVSCLAMLRGHRPPFRILVYFDRKVSPPVFDRWLQLKAQLPILGLNEDYLDVQLIGQEERDGVASIASVRSQLEQKLNSDGTWLLFDNHGKLNNAISDWPRKPDIATIQILLSLT